MVSPCDSRRLALLRITVVTIITLGSLAGAVGCRTDVQDSGVFVGMVGTAGVAGATAGDQVLGAAIWQGDEAILYTCGLGDTLSSSTAWTRSGVLAGTFESANAPYDVVASLDEGRVRGTLVVGDEVRDLDLLPVASANDAGLFQRIDGECRTAAIAIRRAGEIVVQGAHFCRDAAPFFQVTPVRPVEFLRDTLRVRFFDGSETREVDLGRIAEF